MFKNRIRNASFWDANAGVTFSTFPNGVATQIVNQWLLQTFADGGTIPTLNARREKFDYGQELIQDGEPHYNLVIENYDVGASLGPNSYTRLMHRTEDAKVLAGFNVVLSAYIRSSEIHRDFALEVIQHFGTGGIQPISPDVRCAIPAAIVDLDTNFKRYGWDFILPPVQGKIFGSNNDSYTEIRLYFQAGSGLAANLGGKPIPWVGSSSLHTFWGVQLERNSYPTVFDEIRPAEIGLSDTSTSVAYQTAEDSTALTIGTNSLTVTFTSPFTSQPHFEYNNISNIIDSNPPGLWVTRITRLDQTGFTVEFNDQVQNSNTFFNWKASNQNSIASEFEESRVSTIPMGQDFIDITYLYGKTQTPKLVYYYITNTVDVDPPGIWVTGVLRLDDDGFKLQLNDIVQNVNTKLNWMVKV